MTVSAFSRFAFLTAVSVAAWAAEPAAPPPSNPSEEGRAAASETLPERTLRALLERERELEADAARERPTYDEATLATERDKLMAGYDRLITEAPDYASAHAAYGHFLMRGDRRREGAALLLKANRLYLKRVEGTETKRTPPDVARSWALVKNQLGNYLAEEGNFEQALPYFLTAVQLRPEEALYHYNLGVFLYQYSDDLVKAGHFTRPALDRDQHAAFRRAAEYAPDNFAYAYRYAESFYDRSEPDWPEALEVWAALEERVAPGLERQTLQLHQAQVLIKLDRREEARALLDGVTEPALAANKRRLLAELAAPANEPAALR